MGFELAYCHDGRQLSPGVQYLFFVLRGREPGRRVEDAVSHVEHARLAVRAHAKRRRRRRRAASAAKVAPMAAGSRK